MSASVASRALALAWAAQQLGKPVLMTADGTWIDGAGVEREAWDCSSFVADALRHAGGPDLRSSLWTGLMWHSWTSVPAGDQLPGDVALYGAISAGHLTAGHVMLVWPDVLVRGSSRVYGACGAAHSITTLEAARAAGACIRFHDRADYRGDLRGYRRPPYE